MVSLNKNILIFSAVGGILVLDRFLKMLVVVKMKAIEIIPGFFQVIFYPNTKGPFSLPIPLWMIITVSALLIIIFLILILPPPPTSPSQREGEESPACGGARCLPAGDLPKGEGRVKQKIRLPLILITAGAASNLFDRIVYGYTIDTFQFLNFSFFNLSDGLIFAGVILLLYKIVKK